MLMPTTAEEDAPLTLVAVIVYEVKSTSSSLAPKMMPLEPRYRPAGSAGVTVNDVK